MPGRSERIADSIVGTIVTIGGIAVAVVAYNHPYESKKLLTIVTGEEGTRQSSRNLFIPRAKIYRRSSRMV